jgi:hypothetical protein
MGFLLMAWPEPGADYWTRWLPALVTLAAGMTITVAPLTAALFATVDPDHNGLASGVNNAAARVAGMVAVAVFTLVISIAFAQAVGADPEPANQRLAAVMGGAPLQGGVTDAEKAAFRTGFQICMVIGAVFAFASAAIAAATLPKGRLQRG